MTRIVALGILLLAAAALLAAGSLPTAQAAQDKDTKKDTTKDTTKGTPLVPPHKGKSEVLRLFNGKDFDGWEGHEKYWSHKDGVIIGKNTAEDAPKVSTYLETNRKFTDFRLTFGGKLVTSEM